MQQPYGSGPQRPVDVGGVTILVLGILGVTVCGCCAPFAWSMGSSALAELDRLQIYEGNERSMAQIGYILGIVGTLLILAVVLFYLFFGVLAATSPRR